MRVTGENVMLALWPKGESLGALKQVSPIQSLQACVSNKTYGWYV